MKNPYIVLGVHQDATNQEIIRAQATAMRARRYPLADIAQARAILAKPATRLAADITLPVFPDITLPSEIAYTTHAQGLTIESINPNKYCNYE